MTTTTTGLAQFRRLLRSVHYAFGQDQKAIKMATLQLRNEFFKHKDIVDPHLLTTLYKDVDDIDEMLRYHIVQGQKNQKGHYEVSLKPEHKLTIEAEQDRQYGPELTPIDPSFLGQQVVSVTKVKGNKTPLKNVDVTKERQD